jgi:hypothetical protein
MKKTYTINEKKYTQQPLVIGQLSRLLTELKEVKLIDLSPMGLISAFGERLPRLLACVLVPDGAGPREVDVDSLENELWSVDIDTAMEVIADFLSMASLASLSEKLAKMMPGKQPVVETTGPKPSAPPSPAVVH